MNLVWILNEQPKCKMIFLIQQGKMNREISGDKELLFILFDVTRYRYIKMYFFKRSILKNVGVKRQSLESVLKYLRKKEKVHKANMANFCQY